MTKAIVIDLSPTMNSTGKAVIAEGELGKVVDGIYIGVGKNGPYIRAMVVEDTPANRQKAQELLDELTAMRKAYDQALFDAQRVIPHL